MQTNINESIALAKEAIVNQNEIIANLCVQMVIFKHQEFFHKIEQKRSAAPKMINCRKVEKNSSKNDKL